MESEIRVVEVSAERIAAVRARVRRGTVGQAFRAPLDKVWDFLRRHPGLRNDGHNLFLYEHATSDATFLSVDFGVQVVSSFESEGEVRCLQTLSGEAASTVHRGPYEQLPAAHTALHQWCRQHGRRIGGFSWEIYGDWTSDPNQLETTIVYLLQP